MGDQMVRCRVQDFESKSISMAVKSLNHQEQDIHPVMAYLLNDASFLQELLYGNGISTQWNGVDFYLEVLA